MSTPSPKMVSARLKTAAIGAMLVAGFVTPALAQEDKALTIYNWAGYIAPDLVAKFEAETGITVTLDTYDSNETLMAKLSAGSTGYDIAVASADFLPIMIEQGLVQKIDAPAMANYSHLGETWKSREWDPGNVYSVVWNWGTTSVSVDTAVYDGPRDSLGVLFTPPEALRGKIGMSGSASEAVNLALVYLGKPQCTTDPADLKALSELLMAQKPFVKVYDASGVAELLGSGEVVAAQAWSGAAAQARGNRASLAYLYPKEGVYGWADSVVVPKGAAHPENAKAFINFLMDPANAAILSNYTGSPNGMPESVALMDKAVAGAPEFNPPEGTKITFGKLCPEEAVRAYDRIWSRVRG